MKNILMTIAILLLVALPFDGSAQSRVKDLTTLEGLNDLPLVGYGIVVGLDGTGDSPRSIFTNQALANMLERFGISVESNRVRVRNVAAVMVTASLSPFTKVGQTVDVMVSSMGDARSLQGGTLLLTPLISPAEQVYGIAQGAVSIGGFSVESGGVSVRQNATSVGRIPGGFLVEVDQGNSIEGIEEFRYALSDADFTTAKRIEDAINASIGQQIATAIDPVSIQVAVPTDYPGGPLALISDTETVLVAPDVNARVVINERTGTVIIGDGVRLSSVAISHGALSISITNTPVVSQPNAFSQGQTNVQRSTQVQVQEQGTGVVVIQQSANVGDVAGALNNLGVTPRDIIAIFQALKKAGALQAELVII
ncbi:flagellar basal body P-ring protein FlgI [bacterium]|nr:flagellar basal body P-ring protein FlgI [bacterium]